MLLCGIARYINYPDFKHLPSRYYDFSDGKILRQSKIIYYYNTIVSDIGFSPLDYPVIAERHDAEKHFALKALSLV